MATSLPLSVIPTRFKVSSDRGDVNHSCVVFSVTIFFDSVSSANTLESAKN